MKLYNTMSRTIEAFAPLKKDKVNLYVCGLTVYSQPHIGNWVVYIYWDILRRVLEHNNYTVNHIQNITDVGHLTSDEDAGEDKMLASALSEGKTAWEVAEKYIAIAEKEASLLGLKKPTYTPRATEYIVQQLTFVQQLQDMGYTYAIEDGIYFDTSKLNDYGKLARLDIEGLEFGARVAASGKKNPTDFALWKFSPKDQKRDMEWDSPYGKGFPGWHLECSTLIHELLGDTIDIHVGGIDHIPVHHTNEIAQSESLTKKPLAKYWLHANHIKVDGKKMSKSLGNIYTLQDIIDRGISLQAFKLMVLSKHYQTEGNFTFEILEAAHNRLHRWQEIIDLRWQENDSINRDSKDELDTSKIIENLENDLNTVGAISSIESVLAAASSMKNNHTILTKTMHLIKDLLGIDLEKPDITDTQRQLLNRRNNAREQKDWQLSDKLRDELSGYGIGVRDEKNHSTWYRL